MTKVSLLLSLILVMSLPLFAQTTYTQSHPANCQTADYICNGVPLVGGLTYSFQDGGKQINVGDHFALGTSYGSIESVSTEPPTMSTANVGVTGPFEFEVVFQDGSTGTVAGQIQIQKMCGRYCWPYAKIQSSTVTVN